MVVAAEFMNPCGWFMALNVVALVVLSTALVVGPPVGLPLAATGFLTWALAREQLKKC